MTLKYRHVSYEPDFPPVDCIEGEVGGRYRGQQWHLHYPRHLHLPQAHPTLRYRGVTYNMSHPRDQLNVAVGITSTKAKTKAPPVIHRSEPTPDEWQDIHKANVCRLLEHRRQRAEAQGNQQLLELLNSEAQQWVC